MKKSISILFAALLSLIATASTPGNWSSVLSKVGQGKYYSVVKVSGREVLLVADGVWDNGGGALCSIDAKVYMKNSKGAAVCCGTVRSQGTAYPIALNNGRLIVEGHRFTTLYSIDFNKAQLYVVDGFREKYVTPDVVEYKVYNAKTGKWVKTEEGSAALKRLYDISNEAWPIEFVPVGKDGKTFQGKWEDVEVYK